MDGMTCEETGSYIRRHLDIAGRTDPLLSDDAITPSTTMPAANPAPSTTRPWRPGRDLHPGKTIVDESATRAAIAEVIATE